MPVYLKYSHFKCLSRGFANFFLNLRGFMDSELAFITSDVTERIAKVRHEKGVNKKEFAEYLEVTSSIFSDIESGKRKPSRDLLIKISVRYGVSLNWLFYGIGEIWIADAVNSQSLSKTGFKQVPVYSESELPEGAFVVPLLDQRLSAGSGSTLPEEDKTSALVHVPAYLSSYGDKIAALAVDGDSMYPTLHRGDMVVCDSCGWSGEGIYAVRMSGQGFVKRITKRPGKIVIISDNPKYPPQEEPEESEDIQIIGRVHCAIVRVE